MCIYGFIQIDPRNPDPNPTAEVQIETVHNLLKSLMASNPNTFEVLALNNDQSLPIRVLATASHAVLSSTMFVVHYKQW